jgi:hypothetical protein
LRRNVSKPCTTASMHSPGLKVCDWMGAGLVWFVTLQGQVCKTAPGDMVASISSVNSVIGSNAGSCAQRHRTVVRHPALPDASHGHVARWYVPRTRRVMDDNIQSPS